MDFILSLQNCNTIEGYVKIKKCIELYSLRQTEKIFAENNGVILEDGFKQICACTYTDDVSLESKISSCIV